MNLEQYLTFIAITTIVVLSPGPAVLHAINNGIKHGIKASSVAVLGNVFALMLLVIISALGLGAILVASEFTFMVLKIIGAAYLFYLGVKLWRAGAPNTQDHTSHKNKTSISLFREAFLVTATNPKALAYVTALLPQFINASERLTPQIILLGLTIASIQFIILTSYAWFSSRVKPWLEQEKVRIIFNKLTGATFMGFGAALVISDNKI